MSERRVWLMQWLVILTGLAGFILLWYAIGWWMLWLIALALLGYIVLIFRMRWVDANEPARLRAFDKTI